VFFIIGFVVVVVFSLDYCPGLKMFQP
jgi:hypothetical protein